MTHASRYHFPNLGLLIIRGGVGLMMLGHGLPKLLAGPELWAGLGGTMSIVGIHFAPTFWGLLAALAEAGGGLLLALGLGHRLACAALLATMLMATVMHLSKGEGFNDYSHAVELAFLFLGLFFVGPGRLSLDARLFRPAGDGGHTTAERP